MAEYVDLSEYVTATFYSDEYEEWTQQTVTIADVLDSVCDDYTVLPSAQTEIIKCRDCRKYRKLNCPFGITVVDAPDPDGYCYKAERRTDERTD